MLGFGERHAEALGGLGEAGEEIAGLVDPVDQLLGNDEVRAREDFAGLVTEMVVQRNLGSDSLHRWLQSTFPEDFSIVRAATHKGYRVLRGRRR